MPPSDNEALMIFMAKIANKINRLLHKDLGKVTDDEFKIHAMGVTICLMVQSELSLQGEDTVFVESNN